MLCPLCGLRKPKRDCPALGRPICPTCCGTKRLVEINCPPDCGYLASAREHPAAVVKRQRDRDIAILIPTLRRLTERQHQLYYLFQTVIARSTPEAPGRLLDADVVDAVAAVAATLETAARGLIYEHRPTSRAAQQLAQELHVTLAGLREQGGTVNDGEAGQVLRAIEEGARETGKQGGGDTAYLSLMARLLTAAVPDSAGPSRTQTPLILP